MTKEVYQDLLERNLFQSVRKLSLGRRFIFMQDNDPKHTAKIIRTYFKKKKVNTFDWPSQSPDLNPIEHLWDNLERKVRKYHIKNHDDLRKALQDAWDSITTEETGKLVNSMPDRLAAVIQSKGGPTKY